MARHPELVARGVLQRFVVLERAGVRTIVHVGDAVGHRDVAHVGELVLHHLDAQVRRRVRGAVEMHFQLHVSVVEHLAMFHHLVGCHHAGAQGGLVGPAFHETAPEVALVASDLFARVPERMDGQVFAESLGEGVVAQPVVAVVVAVEDRDHRLGRHRPDHADGHLSDLQRSPAVEHDNTFLGDHEEDAGHQALVLLRGEPVLGIDHPDTR